MSTKNLLVELFVEELPPKALKKLGEAFSSVLFETLKSQGLTADESKVTAFASPRRLAAHITQVPAQAADKALSQKLMPVTVGFDAAGNATPALLKRLAALGTDESAIPKLKRESDGKAESLFLDIVQTGAQLAEGLQKALDEALAKLPIPKVMTYQLADGWSNVNFVRPAHGLVALHGNEVVAISALGLQAGNTTHGHRFEAKVETIALKDADSYSEQLKTEGAVIASFDERRNEIGRQLNAAAANENLKPIDDDALLDEVTALVERPNVLLGQFETEYLEVPQECLILTMKANQKYFPLLDANNKLTNKFLIVSNISPADPSAVIGGNERVVRPRLADAKFFFSQDRKKKLGDRLVDLQRVVYHNKLGNQFERSNRVARIAESIWTQWKQGGDDSGKASVNKAALWAKCDLLTDMVGEFPELQGIMGRYYQDLDGSADSKIVGQAIEEHYWPKFAGDQLPNSDVAVTVALADKLETLVGLFGIGQLPTGDKDPFALRRQALGVIRLLLEKSLPLSLVLLLDSSAAEFKHVPEFNLTYVQNNLHDFIIERLDGLLKENGFSAKEIDAVLSNGFRSEQIMLNRNSGSVALLKVRAYLDAVHSFALLPEAESLAAANKRVSNILKKVEGEVGDVVNNDLLEEPAEKALAKTLTIVKSISNPLFDNGDYTGSLQALAALKTPVDAFFDGVMVNATNEGLRANRLALLSQLHQAMNRVADLSKLAS